MVVLHMKFWDIQYDIYLYKAFKRFLTVWTSVQLFLNYHPLSLNSSQLPTVPTHLVPSYPLDFFVYAVNSTSNVHPKIFPIPLTLSSTE